MNLDHTARQHLFDYACSRGFVGTAEEWREEVQHQVYASAVREFRSLDVRVALHGHKDLQQRVFDVCATALARFERVHTSLGNSRHAHISFTERRAPRGGGLQLQQLTVDLNVEGNQSTVLFQGYVDGKPRLKYSCTVRVDWEAKA